MKKKILLAVLGAATALALTGCNSPLADTISDKDRAAFQAACAEARGTFSGKNVWEVPECKVIYQYPAVPAQRDLPGGD